MARLKAVVSDGRGKPIKAAEAAVQAYLDSLHDSVLDAFNAAHTEGTNGWRDALADHWWPIMDEANRILDAHKGDVERPYLKVVRKGGKPPSTIKPELRLDEARKRAREARAEALKGGKQLNVILPKSRIDQAKALSRARGHPNLAALIQELIETASKETTS